MILETKNKKKKDLSESINLIPMINLVFLLLIFFLLTGVIQKQENKEIERPYSMFVVKKEMEKDAFILSVLSDGSIYFNERKLSLEEFRGILKKTDLKIKLDVDKNLKIVEFNKIIKIIKSKKIKKIHLKVSDQGDLDG